MTEPILWLHFSRPRSSWYRLTETDQRQLEEAWAQAAATATLAGGHKLGRYRTRGQSDFENVEVWTFPDVDTAVEHWARLCSARYADYVVHANTIGVPGDAARDAR